MGSLSIRNLNLLCVDSSWSEDPLFGVDHERSGVLGEFSLLKNNLVLTRQVWQIIQIFCVIKVLSGYSTELEILITVLPMHQTQTMTVSIIRDRARIFPPWAFLITRPCHNVDIHQNNIAKVHLRIFATVVLTFHAPSIDLIR